MKATRLPLVLAALAAAGEAAAQPAQVTIDLGVPLELTLVPAGSFRQGSPAEETDRHDDEAPRDVTLTRAFYLGVVPVTRAQFEAFTASAPYRTESEVGRSGGFGLEGGRLVQNPQYNWRTPGFAQEGTHPAVIVTFDDAQRFLAWASGRAGHRLRLPTEAEWERACRAGTSTAWYTGNTVDYGRAAGWYLEVPPVGTRPVRGRLPNGYGLFDMVGHVQQWVDDWYAPYGSAAATDPHVQQPDPAVAPPPRRVLRGGSWLRPVAKGRCAARERAAPGSRNADTGFRVAMDASEGVVTPPPAPPQPPPAPPPPMPVIDPTPPGTSSEVWGVFALVGGLFATGAGLVAALVLRSRRSAAATPDRRPKGGAVGAQDVRVVPAADGFRVFAPPHRVGQRAHIEYSQGGLQRTKWVVLERSTQGQFVYTGATPEALVIIALAQSTRGGGSHGGGSRHDDHGHFGGHDDHGSSFDHSDHGSSFDHSDHGSSFGHSDHGSSFGHSDHGSSSSHDEPAPMPVYQGPPSAY